MRAYRTRMAHFAEASPLDIWYDRIDLAKAMAETTDKDARKRRENLQRQAQKRVAENLFPKLVANEGGELRIVDQPPLIFHNPEVTPEVVEQFLAIYAESLPGDRRVLLRATASSTRPSRWSASAASAPAASPPCSCPRRATRCSCRSRKPTAPCWSSTSTIRRPTHNGERVVLGQHLMQPASDIFLGSATGPAGRDFYVRQLRDMKVSVTLVRDPVQLNNYAEFCGLALARAHANTGSAAMIAGYLGTGSKADASFAEFGLRYADQTERDHRELVEAIDSGRVEAISDTM